MAKPRIRHISAQVSRHSRSAIPGSSKLISRPKKRQKRVSVGRGRYQSLNRHESSDNVAVMHGIRHAGRGNGHKSRGPGGLHDSRWRGLDSNFQYAGAVTTYRRRVTAASDRR